MPEENQPVTTQEPGGQQAAPSPQSAASTQSAQSPPSTPSPSQAPSTPAAQSQSEWTGVRDALRAFNPTLADRFQDDQSALQQLAASYDRAQQLAPLAQYGQEYVRHADQFRAWQALQEQEAQKQAQAKQQPWYQQWWNPPEYDPSWEGLLEKDPQTGQLRARAGAPADLPDRYARYQQYRRQQADKLLANPLTFLEEPVKFLAEQVARQVVQQNLGGYQETAQAKQLIDQNANWLYQNDGQGNFQFDPQTGQRQLSPWGQRYSGYLREATSRGVGNVDHQHQYAMGMIQRDYALLQLQQQGGQRQQANQDFLNQNQTPGAQNAPNAVAAKPGAKVPLNQRLRNSFAKAGVKESDFR